MSDERYSVSIGSLDLDRIIDAVGIYNEIIKETYDRVVSEYGMLKDIVYSRVQGYRPIDDNYLGDLIESLEVSHLWGSKESDRRIFLGRSIESLD